MWPGRLFLTILLLNDVLEKPRSQMTPGIHGDDLLWVSPLRERADLGGGLRVGKVGSGMSELTWQTMVGSIWANLCSKLSCLLATARA